MPQRNTDRRRNFWLFPASYQYPRPSEPPMSLRDALRIPSSAITDESVYRQTRQLLAAFAAAPAPTLAGCADAEPPPPTPPALSPQQAPYAPAQRTAGKVDEHACKIGWSGTTYKTK